MNIIIGLRYIILFYIGINKCLTLRKEIFFCIIFLVFDFEKNRETILKRGRLNSKLLIN